MANKALHSDCQRRRRPYLAQHLLTAGELGRILKNDRETHDNGGLHDGPYHGGDHGLSLSGSAGTLLFFTFNRHCNRHLFAQTTPFVDAEVHGEVGTVNNKRGLEAYQFIASAVLS